MIVGNWKMNGLRAQLSELQNLASALSAAPVAGRIGVCPPATLLTEAAALLRESSVELGAQDCHPEPKGAFTGDISAEMLADAGARLVIVGHSERRWGHGESSAVVAAKATAAARAALEPIVCVGERLEERQAGQAVAVVLEQLRASIPEALQGRAFHVAYEPVWAIGSGLTPSLADIAEVHAALREGLEGRFGAAGKTTAILYGGSVKPENAAAILNVAEVDGALVGGASLMATDFLQIIRAR
jgi:triosephosphate isomerase